MTARMGIRWRFGSMVWLAALAACGGAATDSAPRDTSAAPAGAIRVNHTGDGVDAAPGDLVCATADGMCTLRAAIMEANASGYNAAGQRHSILIPPGLYTLDIPNALTTADLGLDEVIARPFTASEATGSLILAVPMRLIGAGARATIIDAQGLDRVFELKRGADSRFSDMTVTGGAGNTLGGGIYAQAHLTVERVLVTGNESSGGGGIFVNPLGSLDLRDSTVSYNIAKGQAGGIRIDTRGTITNSTISHNEAMGLTDTPPDGTGVPFAFAQGGGIDVRGLGVVIRNSTIAFNRSAAGGAGIHFDTAYIDALPDTATGAVEQPLFDLILENTIVANNSADVEQADCLVTVGVSRILSQGHNLDSDGSCRLDHPGDLPGLDPQLSALADHGGPTDTHALLPASPARDAGQMRNCAAADQRGVPRGSDGACDIGAFETQG